MSAFYYLFSLCLINFIVPHSSIMPSFMLKIFFVEYYFNSFVSSTILSYFLRGCHRD